MEIELTSFSATIHHIDFFEINVPKTFFIPWFAQKINDPSYKKYFLLLIVACKILVYIPKFLTNSYYAINNLFEQCIESEEKIDKFIVMKTGVKDENRVEIFMNIFSVMIEMVDEKLISQMLVFPSANKNENIKSIKDKLRAQLNGK